ncbi:MAG: MFS transporter [Fimbriimonadaceae bacterium]|nr:MFS transporter [Fimbriimonadaceae bacterium]
MARRYFDLSVYWFGLTLLWAGLLTIVMPYEVARLAGPSKDLALSLLLACGAALSTAACLVAGTLSDHSHSRWGRRRPLLALGTLLTLPALLFLPWCQSLLWLLLAFAHVQWWANVATAPYQAMMPDQVPRAQQGVASAWLGGISLVGQLSGLLLCGALITQPGGLARIAVALTVVLALTAGYTVWRLPEPSAVDNPLPCLALRGLLRRAVQFSRAAQPDFLRLVWSRFGINLGFYSCTEFLLYYVSDTLRAAHPVQVVTAIFVVVTVAGLLGNLPAGYLADRTSKRTLVFVAMAICVAAAVVFVLAASLPVAFAAAALFGFGWGAFMAVDWAFATVLLPPGDEARSMGLWHMSCTVPQVLAPLLGGPLAYVLNREYGQGCGYRAVLVMVIVWFCLGTWYLRPIREPDHDARRGRPG